MLKAKTQTFNDGIINIYSTDVTACKGHLPIEQLKLKTVLRYEERIVGLTRYYNAQQIGVNIKHVLRCPINRNITPEDIINLNGEQYRIMQIQYPKNVDTPVMDLTLVDITEEYEVK